MVQPEMTPGPTGYSPCCPKGQRRMTQSWRYNCPITGCKNFGERGYARSTFIAHLNTHCRTLLTDESEKSKALQAVKGFGDLGWCSLCGKFNLSANGRPWCKKCRPERGEFATTTKTLSQFARKTITARIRKANQTELRVISEIPFLLRRHWSRCVSTTLALFLGARTDYDSFRALEVWCKLKSVLILPLKGGTTVRNEKGPPTHFLKKG